MLPTGFETATPATDRSQKMNVNIINYKTACQNIVIDVIMNLHYSFVIIKCKSYCKTKAYVM